MYTPLRRVAFQSISLVSVVLPGLAVAQPRAPETEPNLAVMATIRSSNSTNALALGAMADCYEPRSSGDRAPGVHTAGRGPQWVEYEWSQPVSIESSSVYWFAERNNYRAPAKARALYWNGSELVPWNEMGVEPNKYNTIDSPEITTSRLRLEFEPQEGVATGILEWKVLDNGKSPKFAPRVTAGEDRIVIRGAKTFLNATVRTVGKPAVEGKWSKVSGPGTVEFADPTQAKTTATVSEPGDYVLQFTAGLTGERASESLKNSSTLRLGVEPPAPTKHLHVVNTSPYRIDSQLWKARLKALIVGWIPHCYEQLSNLDLPQGGINNFIQAANKLNGREHTANQGYPFTDAYVHNTVEAMSWALMYDAQGDAEILAAQEAMRKKLDEWIPLILAAQEPDGYLQTRFTRDKRGAQRWTIVGDHEGYVGGYFLEAAIAHYKATEGKDRRLLDAARRLADCWDANIGPPPKKRWYDGHQGMEYALVRFGRLIDEVDGPGAGAKYVTLSKFLLDCRQNGSTYDQTHRPVVQQYEAAGHAVRAVYQYAAMNEIARATGDIDYQSAVRSLWDNVVNRKYYLTGGVGSGETSEGFGPDYSLRNTGYCESCSSCGEIFFQASMNRVYRDARYADLFEQTLYNALLGSFDMEGKNFWYTNPLDARGQRTPWHVCPCCVGNIPRTLLQLPTWMYATEADAVYVNLYVGSSVSLGNVAGTPLRLVQETDYPWSGDVTIHVKPQAPKSFSVYLRAPKRDVSTLYSGTPLADGITKLAVNGSPVEIATKNGLVEIKREWKDGDRIELSLPMSVQRVKTIDKVAANRGRVALRFGPLVYSIESIEGDINRELSPGSPLATEWRGDLLGGVRVITGKFADDSPLVAIPNYARNNRGGGPQARSIVWIKEASANP